MNKLFDDDWEDDQKELHRAMEKVLKNRPDIKYKTHEFMDEVNKEVAKNRDKK